MRFFPIGLFLLVLSLFAAGLLMVFSSSMEFSQVLFDKPFYLFHKQVIFGVLGFFLMAFVCFLPTRFVAKRSRIVFLFSLVLLLLLFIPGFGVSVKGSLRWLSFGVLRVQPGELLKLCFIIFLSSYLARHHATVESSGRVLLSLSLVLSICGALLLLQPDYGSFFILCVLTMVLLFLAGLPLRWFTLFGMVLGCFLLVLVFFSDYRLARLISFLDPWDDPLGSDYQISNALIAFGNGGLFGAGPGESLQKMLYVPDAYTDFLFAILVEEFGFLGGLVILLAYVLFFLMGLRSAKLAMQREDFFGFFLAYGVSFWVLLQAFINMAVNLGFLPTKGLTLPLMSYGGSSLLTYMMAVGLLMRVEIENRRFFGGHVAKLR